MTSERDYFDLSGPLNLTCVHWTNAYHRKSVVASLVQGVYVLEKDRQEQRKGPYALAPAWWSFFHFHLLHTLTDDADNSIFGAIYEFNPPPPLSMCNNDPLVPRYVIAFRGTITKVDSIYRDVELDLHLVKNQLHQTSRFEIAIQAVRNMLASNVGISSNIWLAGHSLGSAIALLCGKTMARNGIFMESFLFNPPYLSAPIERVIKDKKLKHRLRIAASVITAGLAITMKKSLAFDSMFSALSDWIPCLFVNPSDPICSEYVGYFEHRGKMEEIGGGIIEKFATQNSLVSLMMCAFGKESESEPLHLIPSANVTVNLTPPRDFREAHGIHQWWKLDLLQLESKLYKYD